MFRLPIKYHIKTSVMFPAMRNGIILQNGPMPKNFAMTGDAKATDKPDAIPQVITKTISNRLTTDPVIIIFPNGAVAACNTTNKAAKIAVWVI